MCSCHRHRRRRLPPCASRHPAAGGVARSHQLKQSIKQLLCVLPARAAAVVAVNTSCAVSVYEPQQLMSGSVPNLLDAYSHARTDVKRGRGGDCASVSGADFLLREALSSPLHRPDLVSAMNEERLRELRFTALLQCCCNPHTIQQAASSFRLLFPNQFSTGTAVVPLGTAVVPLGTTHTCHAWYAKYVSTLGSTQAQALTHWSVPSTDLRPRLSHHITTTMFNITSLYIDTCVGFYGHGAPLNMLAGT